MDIGRPTQRAQMADHLLWRCGHVNQRDRPQSDTSIPKYQGTLCDILVIQHGCQSPSQADDSGR
jgi:hypothetical protein